MSGWVYQAARFTSTLAKIRSVRAKRYFSGAKEMLGRRLAVAATDPYRLDPRIPALADEVALIKT